MLPLLDFGDILYMIASQDLLSRLDIIQNNACRVILGKNKYTNAQSMLSELKLLHLYARRNFHLACTMYKTINGHIKSIEFGLMFELVEETRDRVTCANSSGNLSVIKHRTGFGAKCIQVYGPVHWNKLPAFIKLSKSLGIFRSNHQRHYPI